MNVASAGVQVLRRARRGERGFTLIELGIVIAVIAVLATVVLMGRGFIDASRQTKLVEALDAVQKAASTVAGLQGGTLTTSTANEMGGLNTRVLIPSGAPWTVSTGFQITDVRFQAAAAGVANRVLIRSLVPSATAGLDFVTAASRSQNFVGDGSTVGTLVCSTVALGSTTTPNVCFNL